MTLIVTPFYFLTVEALGFIPLTLGFIFPPNFNCSYFVKFLGCLRLLFTTNISPSALTNKGSDATEA